MSVMAPIESEVRAPAPADWRSRLPRSRWSRGALLLLPIALVAGVGARLVQGDAPAAVPPPPLVTVALPLQRDVTEWDDYVGRFAPSKAVELRPRVSGALTGIYFQDGSVVRKGQLLFRIDPRPFQAALAEARARDASARSALLLARSALARATRLIADEAVAAAEVDELRAGVRAAEAAVAGAQAQVRARALEVEFTEVRAPIGGRISDRRVDVGNLVAGGDAGSATLLTTVYALDPIYFAFDGSEALYLKSRRAGGDAGGAVEIRLQDEPGYRWRGRIDFSDNGIASGTIRGRAVIANPDYFLTPGMFGNMRLASAGTHRALLVPDSAIVADQARKTVQVVGRGNVVTLKPVELGPLVDGLRVIRSGLSPADRVVIAGIQNAMPGAPVRPRLGRADVVRAAAPAPQNRAPIASQATFAAR